MAVPEILRYRNSIDYEVSGDYALFSDPITRASGEKCSYHLPTYSALVGITSSIYWKPTFMWVIDYVRIMNPIITEKRGVKIHDYNTNTVDLFYYMYLKDVRYQVRAHMIPNVNHPEFANDWNENKHHNIAKRSVKSGGRRNPFLGTSECFAFVDECVFGEGESYYDNLPGQIEYGNMFHSFTFPDQAIREDEKGKLIVNFWNPVLQPGEIVKFIRPEECKSKKFIRNMPLTQFEIKNPDEITNLEKY